jgi:hypothetical protein
MRVRNPPIPSATIQGSGPGEYFFRKTNARGEKREPAPRRLFGDPHHFDRLVRFSPAPHPHLHCVLGYKGETVAPSRRIKDLIMAMYLHLLRGGLTDDKVYELGVDHGDHDHAAMFRHLVARDWPRFQPCYHKHDWLLMSDFQWLVNRRYKFNAPEDPKNAQLVSLAGRKFGNEEIQFLAELRAEVVEQRSSGLLQDHAAFLHHLQRVKGCQTELLVVTNVEDPVDEESDDPQATNRVWIKITAPNGLVVPIKGPFCNPDFPSKDHEKKQEQKTKLYQAFVRDPSEVWQRFCNRNRKRRQYNRERHPLYCAPGDTDPNLAFEDLEPSRHLAPASPALPGIH